MDERLCLILANLTEKQLDLVEEQHPLSISSKRPTFWLPALVMAPFA